MVAEEYGVLASISWSRSSSPSSSLSSAESTPWTKTPSTDISTFCNVSGFEMVCAYAYYHVSECEGGGSEKEKTIFIRVEMLMRVGRLYPPTYTVPGTMKLQTYSTSAIAATQDTPTYPCPTPNTRHTHLPMPHPNTRHTPLPIPHPNTRHTPLSMPHPHHHTEVEADLLTGITLPSSLQPPRWTPGTALSHAHQRQGYHQLQPTGNGQNRAPPPPTDLSAI